MNDNLKLRFVKFVIALVFALMFLASGIYFIVCTIAPSTNKQVENALFVIGSALVSIGVKLFPTRV